uniref:Major capsid protein n=1 Tax=viral metagenome TaxID=1070528 RepID=A0A6C0F4G8_9ZZZZ|tara:strand:- start:1279 stop:2856 length:1578 start_codon:yes stop_codon:yes gene_type:complete
MGGGLMQLVAYGAQDIYLTGNPQITFFKVVYRRHTNFSMEAIEQTIQGASSVAASSGSGTVTISRNGDLVYKVYVTSSSSGITDGDSIVNEVELEIGGQQIDRHYKEWNQIWNELSTPESKAVGLKSMKGCVGSSGTTGASLVQVPLQFWFCRNPGLALPLIALQYHEVKLKITWGSRSDVGTGAECKVFCDYIYLDTDERRRFAQVSHEYLIEQLQKQSADTSKSVKLNFNHPVKELIWTSNATNAYTTAQLKLNGHDRFSAQEEEYFQLRQPYDYHTAVPRQNLPIPSRVNNSGAIDVFSGTYTETTIEAMDFANSVVTSGDVIVSQGGTGAADISGITAAVTAGEAETATTLVYSFRKTDLAVLPKVDDVLSVRVGGVCSANNAATSDTTSVTIIAKVTGFADGALAGGLTNSNNYHIQLDVSLCEGTLGAEIDGADDFKIFGMKMLASQGARTSQMTKKINVYSFALKPEEHQPSGTCNFSRIDAARLDTAAALEAADNIYAVNYNVLRIMSGMGGLAYSN